MRIYLLGYMGCGKSTLGPKLANHYNLPFYDLDQFFEEKYRIKISDFFHKYSEQHFRVIEQSLLHEISQEENFIIATGGGTPCFHENMEFMNSMGITVYLQLPLTALLSRLHSSQRKRPLLNDFRGELLDARVKEHLEEREKFYLKSKVIYNKEVQYSTELAALIDQVLV